MQRVTVTKACGLKNGLKRLEPGQHVLTDDEVEQAKRFGAIAPDKTVGASNDEAPNGADASKAGSDNKASGDGKSKEAQKTPQSENKAAAQSKKQKKKGDAPINKSGN